MMNQWVYICRVKPWGYFYASDFLVDIFNWWDANEDACGERQVRKIRWSMTKDVKDLFEEANTLLDEDKAKEAASRVVPLRAITGGKGPDNPNWLDQFDVGGAFCARERSYKGTGLVIYQVSFKSGSACKLRWQTNDLAVPMDGWFDSVKFSQQNELVEILAYKEVPDDTEQPSD